MTQPSTPVMYVEKMREDAITPSAGSAHAAGLDLATPHYGCIPPGEKQLVGTGLRVAVPMGYYGRIAPRSGLALKHGIDTLAGVIDSDYRGEIGVLLINHGDEDFNYFPGDRVAQLVIERIAHPRVVMTDAIIDVTQRGNGGFGSTGR